MPERNELNDMIALAVGFAMLAAIAMYVDTMILIGAW